MPEEQSLNIKQAVAGVNLNSVTSQIKQGSLTWAINAVVSSFDGNEVVYSNEQANTFALAYPAGYRVIGSRNILEENLIIWWLTNPSTGDCEIGKSFNNSYSKIINSKCLGFSISNPIQKHAHRNTNCGLEIYWVDGKNRARFINLNDLPYKEIDDPNNCSPIQTEEIDCNKLNLQPNILLPNISVKESNSGGSLKAGQYSFGVQYSNSTGDPYTSFFSITNGAPIFNGAVATQDFDFDVNKAIDVYVDNIDSSGVYEYINIVAIKVVNNITSSELVGTYKITGPTFRTTYSGQADLIQLDIRDVFQKYELYSSPNDLTVAQDVLILADLSTEDRISYQSIASQIKLQWQTNRLKGDSPYAKMDNAVNFRGYMRDEVYAVDIVFMLKNGHQTDRFPTIGRGSLPEDIILVNNKDAVSFEQDECSTIEENLPKWKVYNTASKIASLHPEDVDECYEGPWEYGDFAYWESTEKYPCNKDIWGDLADTPIRLPKFPDSLVTHIHDDQGYIYPIGIRINVDEVISLIRNSSLSEEQKDNIAAFKIVRSNRAGGNASVIAKGLINNVLKYSTENNIIDATTGSSEGGNSAETSTRNMLNKAYDYTNKAHKEFNASRFLGVIGTITIGLNIQQNNRYHNTEDLIDDVRDSEDVFTEQNVQRLEEASSILQEIIEKSLDDKRGQAHATAAKALVDGLIEIIKSQIEVNALLDSVDLPETTLNSDANKFAFFPNYLFNDVRIAQDGTPSDFFLDNTIIDDDAKKRFAFHSPDTHFTQPSLGNTLKLETVEYGVSTGHLVEVKEHARYQFISTTGYITALLAGVSIGFASGSYGAGSVNIFNGQAAFTAYQAFLDILYKTIPRKNFAYQWNAVGEYSSYKPVQNNGDKQRLLELANYMAPGKLNMGDVYTVNNYQRESSVYLKTSSTLPFTHEAVDVPQDASKIAGATLSSISTPISSYYASIKTNIDNQYGQIDAYQSVDTGYQKNINLNSSNQGWDVIFGGDVFINKFAFKNKIPFFIDNRVKFPDGADISYNELSNVGRVKYWFSTDVTANSSIFDSFFATMTQHFFWPRVNELYMSGVIFLFGYGIPYFFCESTVNVDLRQAFNNKEGDFYPHVSSGIPDDWLQEINVSIAQDNTYYYNKSFSKQNDFNLFTSLPVDYDFNECRTRFPFRAVFSDHRTDDPNPSNRNNWRIFKPASVFDFPQNYGRLTSVDGIENKAVLARFENKTLLYNALLTMPTSREDAYLGQSLFSGNVPPIDFAETDLGYVGSQHKFILKTQFGHIVSDAKRGQMFLIQGTQAKDISGEWSKFFEQYLPFSILDSFPTYDIDNNYNGIGLHGVQDHGNDRVVITKTDYAPIVDGISVINGRFAYQGYYIEPTDTRYFCNYSFTCSYCFKTNSWMSFHTYFPDFYVGDVRRFYSGNNSKSSTLWEHSTSITKFNNFYDKIHPYIIEYPYQYGYHDEIIQNFKDYSRVLKYNDFREYVETDDDYFNKMVIYSTQQSSGLLNLVVKAKNNLFINKKYPQYNIDSKSILVTKSNSYYNVNTLWDMIKSVKQPVWLKSCNSTSEYKVLNQDNHNYSKLSYKKAPIRSRELKVRLILDDKDDVKILSGFTVNQSVKTYK